MKTTKRVLAVFMTVLMIVLAVPLGALADLDLSTLSLKAHAAINYSYYPVSAAQWAKDHCKDYKSVLLGKGYYSKGGDCANFVSQCLYMGGIDMQNIWNTAGWYAHWNTKDIATEYQGSFIRVDQLYNYLVKQLNASVKNNPSASDLKVGDVLIYAAKSASDKTHSAIVIEINNGTPKIAYHSVDGAKDRVITTDWKINFKGSLIWRVRPAGQPCVNPNPRSIWVYKVKKETALRKSASASASALNYFLYNSEGEYALVTEKSSDGKWGKTYRYGKWGWVKLADFSGGAKYTASKGEHLFGAWVTTKQATCLVDGQQTRTCTRCGYKETKTLKGGHRIDPHATCLDYGVCTVCGLKVENPLGHDWDDGTVTVQPTCLDSGVKTFVCKRDASHTYTEVVSALGHDYQIADIGNATCVTSGMVKYVCSRCGDSYETVADENNVWTDWTTEELDVPANRVKTKTQYRYSDKSTKTSSQSSESGWTLDSSTWQWGPYGDWSAWSKTAVTASESREIETKTVTDQAAYDQYLLFYIYYKNKNDNKWYYTYSLTYAKNNAVGGNYDHQKRWTNVSEIKKTGKEYGAFIQYVKKSGYYNQSGELWFYESDCASDKRTIPAVTHKEYRYRDRNKVYTYYFSKWSDFSEWQDEPVTASDTRNVETRTVYQYDLRALGHDFSVPSDKEFVKQNQFLHSTKSGDQITLLDGDTCSVTGFTCSRCGAEAPDSTVVQHVFTGTADETLNGETGTVYKEYCKNGCGCYILWDDHYQTDPCSFEQKQIAPTCTTDGYTLSNCTVHGEALKSDYILALGHEIPENDAGVITKNPSCTEPGEITHYCVRYDEGVTCDHRVTEVIPALGHVMTYHAATVSCTEEGNIEYYFCEQCSKFFADEAGDHQLTEEELIVPATGHNGLDENGNEVWTLEKETMCGDPGLERMYCQNPWCKFSDEDCEVHLTQHTFMIDERQTYIDPDYYVRSADYAIWNEAEDQWVGTTCLENGVLHWTCRNCEGTESEHGFDSMVDPAPHTPGDWIVVEPISCTHEGVEVQKCTVCGIDLDYRYTECSGHSTSPLEDGFASSADQMELISSVPNVCGTGTVDTYQCTHVWDGQRCNYTVVIGQPADHTLGEWYVVQPATCEESGLEQRDCINNNDYSETREIDPLGHDLVLEKHIAATCTEPGKNRYYCQRTGCGYTVEEDLVEEPALGHDLGGNYNITKKANCLENGEKVLYCCRVNNGTVCNAQLDVKAILARGQDNDHIWSDWEVVKPLTANEPGLERRVCLNQDETEEYEACAAYETRPINGHQAIFMAKGQNGEYVEVGRVNFAEGTTAISAPDFENYDDRFVAYWPDFSDELAKNEDFVVKAVYQPKGTIVPSDLETDKTVKYVKSDATVTLSAFAETLNVRPKLGAEPVDIVLVLDHSKSMVDNKMSDNKTTRYKALQNSAKAFVENVFENAEFNNVNHRIAVVAYNKTAYAFNGSSWVPTSNYKPSFTSVLNNKAGILQILDAPRQNSSGTCTDSGLDAARDLLKKDGSRKQIVVLFTDGEPTSYSIDGASGFSISVANSAISISKDIKQNYNAPVYCIGVTKDAKPGDPVNLNPSSTKDKLNTFLHAVSSNYPNATELKKIGNRISSSEENSYYVAATSTDELTGLFNNIVSEQITNNITFQNLTIVDTVSKYFTLTQLQESALRQSLLETYGVTNDRITVTRNDDGTTTICIANISPKSVEKDGKSGYGITVSYEVTANENAINAGTYSAVNASGEDGQIACIMKDGEVYAEFTLEEIGSFTVKDPRYIVRYVVEGETIDIVDIESSMLNQEVETPNFALLKLAEENSFVVSDQDTVIHYTYLNEQHTVTWIVAEETRTDSYYSGAIIRVPEVNAAEGYLFAGWDGEVPFRMGSSDLIFVAKFVAHTHDHFKTVSGSCDTGATYTYTCSCGHSYTVTAEPTAHVFVANVAYHEDVAYASVTCSACGKVYQEETAIAYQAAASDRADAEFFDLTLQAGSTPVQPDGTIIVRVALEEDNLLNADKLYAFRIEDGGKTEVQVEKDGSFALLYLDHFSYYMITDKPEDQAQAPAFQSVSCMFNGHSYTETVTPPTCTSKGYTSHTCSSCGDSFTDSEVPAKGHSFGAWTRLDNNQHQRVCANDSTHVEKANHTWNGGAVSKNAKCEEAGTRTYTCSTCNATRSETIQALGHTAPNSKGNCDRCGTHLKDVDPGNSTPAGACKYCGQVHTGPFGWLIKFFHSILALFGLRK